jgi:hypothetical protein
MVHDQPARNKKLCCSKMNADKITLTLFSKTLEVIVVEQVAQADRSKVF